MRRASSEGAVQPAHDDMACATDAAQARTVSVLDSARYHQRLMASRSSCQGSPVRRQHVAHQGGNPAPIQLNPLHQNRVR